MLKAVKVAILSAAVMMSSAALAATSTAPAMKIGVVDIQQVIQQSPDVAAVNKKLQTEFQPREQKIIEARKNLQEEVAQLEKNAPTMTTQARDKMRDKIIADRAAWQGMVQSFQQDLFNAKTQANNALMAKLQTAVDKVAAQDGYALIVQRGAVLYMQPNMDATKQVMAAMPK